MKKDLAVEKLVSVIAESLYSCQVLEEADMREKTEKTLYEYFRVYGKVKENERIRTVRIIEKNGKKQIVVEYADNQYNFYTKKFSYDKVLDEALCIKQKGNNLYNNTLTMLDELISKFDMQVSQNPVNRDLTFKREVSNIFQKITSVNWNNTFLSEKEISEIMSIQSELIEIAKGNGILLGKHNYRYEEPLLSDLDKATLSFDDKEYLKLAEEYLKKKKLEIPDQKFEKLSVEKKVEITCNNILYDKIGTIQLKLIKSFKCGERVIKADIENKQTKKREQSEVMDKILSGEEISEGAVSPFIHSMSNWRDYYNEDIESFARPYMLEDINKKIQAIEILKQRYPDKMNYDMVLVNYKNWQQFLSIMLRYFTSNCTEREKASGDLFLYSHKKWKEQLEVLGEYTKKYRGMNNDYRKAELNFDYFSAIETLETGIRVLNDASDWDNDRRKQSMQKYLTLIEGAQTAIQVSNILTMHPTLPKKSLLCSQIALEAYVSAKNIINQEKEPSAIGEILPILNEQINLFEENIPSEVIDSIQVDKVGVPKKILKKIGNG